MFNINILLEILRFLRISIKNFPEIIFKTSAN